MSVDPEIKKRLDMKLVTGQITLADYEARAGALAASADIEVAAAVPQTPVRLERPVTASAAVYVPDPEQQTRPELVIPDRRNKRPVVLDFLLLLILLAAFIYVVVGFIVTADSPDGVFRNFAVADFQLRQLYPWVN